MRLTTMMLAAVAVIAVSASTAQAASTAPIFAVGCPVSHRAADDPIVYPGQKGAAHSHDFSGNWTTRFDSTYDSLRRAAALSPGTTCSQQADTAPYWVPTLYDASGRTVSIRAITIYYVPGKKDPRTVQAPRPDLKMIADMSASGAHGSGWHCGDATPPSSGGTLNTTGPPDCRNRADGSGGTFPDDTRLQAKIVFPDCWDGKNLDSSDHRSHMAYARSGGVCPSSHPVPVPRLNMKVQYDSYGGKGFKLSSGAPSTMHADFWNAWDQAELEKRVEMCIRNVVDSSKAPCTEPGNPVTVANPNYPDPSEAPLESTSEPAEPTPEPAPEPTGCAVEAAADSPVWCDATAHWFDGSTKVDLPDLAGTLGDFTMEARITPTALDATRWAFGATQGSEKIALMTVSDSMRGLVSVDGSALQLKLPTTTLSVKRHVALTREGSTYRLYVDGVLRHKASGPTGTVDPDRWALGANPGGYAYFKGGLEDAAFYTRALAPDRVAAHAADR